MRMTVLLPYIAIGLLILAYLIKPGPEVTTATAHEANTHDYQQEIIALQHRIDSLEQENNILRSNSRITLPTHRHPPEAPQPLNDDVVSSVDIAQKVEEQIAIIEYARSFGEALMNNVTTNPEYNLTQDLEQRFLQEPVDANWSTVYEDKLHQLFDSHIGLRDLALESISCKTRGCQIKILLADLDKADEASKALRTAIKDNDANLTPTAVIAALKPEDNTLNLYLARDNDSNLLR